MNRIAMQAPTTHSGTAATKMYRQPSVLVTIPPKIGPTACAPAAVAAFHPSPRASVDEGSMSEMVGVVLVIITAAPISCSARAAKSTSIVGDSAHPTVATAKTPMPPR